MSIRPSRLLVFAILTFVLLGLEAKPLRETFDVSEDNTLNEVLRDLMEEKRDKASLSTRILKKLTKSNECPYRFQHPDWCRG